jgi:hypothetical protein
MSIFKRKFNPGKISTQLMSEIDELSQSYNPTESKDNAFGWLDICEKIELQLKIVKAKARRKINEKIYEPT